MITILACFVAVTLFTIYAVIPVLKNMPKVGSPLFKIGYALYTGTRIGLLYHLRQIRAARAKFPSGHSLPAVSKISEDLDVVAVPIIEDNYAYIVHNKRDNCTLIVDPSDADTVVSYLNTAQLPPPTAVLTTHKHWDHAGGNRKMRRHYPGCVVYGSDVDSPWGVTCGVRDQVALRLGSLEVVPYHTPGHTTGHVSYLVRADTPVLFTGDLLFLGGIGRMFEGPAATMLSSLDVVAGLPEDTRLFPGHEYAQDNLEFAASLDPDNLTLLAKLEEVRGRRSGRLPTCPSTLREEKLYNIFLRTRVPQIHQAVGFTPPTSPPTGEDRVAVLSRLRVLKDKFKYKL